MRAGSLAVLAVTIGAVAALRRGAGWVAGWRGDVIAIYIRVAIAAACSYRSWGDIGADFGHLRDGGFGNFVFDFFAYGFDIFYIGDLGSNGAFAVDAGHRHLFLA